MELTTGREDVFAIQDEISRSIVDALKLQLGDGRADLFVPRPRNQEVGSFESLRTRRLLQRVRIQRLLPRTTSSAPGQAESMAVCHPNSTCRERRAIYRLYFSKRKDTPVSITFPVLSFST